MDKNDVAKELGMSVRAVERAVERRRLHAEKFPKVGGGFKWEFSAEEVERYRAERDAQVSHLPPGTTAMVAQRDANVGELAEAFKRIAAVLESRMADVLEPHFAAAPPHGVVVPVESKMVLSLAEAVALSGIPRDRLREAIDARKLKAFNGTLGRGFRIRRSDLDAWVAKLK